MCCGLLWFEPKGKLQYDAVQVYKAPWREWVETQTAGRKKKKKIKMILEMIISVEYATYAVVKINPEKNFRLASIRTRIPVPGRGGAPDFKWGGLEPKKKSLEPPTKPLKNPYLNQATKEKILAKFSSMYPQKSLN